MKPEHDAPAARPTPASAALPAFCDSASGRWPLLARLPNVSAGPQLGPAVHHRQAMPEPRMRPLGHRFDTPVPRSAAPIEKRGEDPRGTADNLDAAILNKHPDRSPDARSPLPAPHDAARPAAPLRAIRPASDAPLLPNSDLFFRAEGNLHDSMVPLIRFLLLVALFTIAGTSVMMMYRATPAIEVETLPPAAATVEAPQPVQKAPSAIGPARRSLLSAELTAAPIDSNRKQTAESKSLAPATNGGETAAAAVSADSATTAGGPGNETSSYPSSYPSTALPAVAMPGSASVELPRVRTAEAPTSVAEFSGQIITSTPLQAHHDDHESRVH